MFIPYELMKRKFLTNCDPKVCGAYDKYKCIEVVTSAHTYSNEVK
jgi:hypothetical protein